MSLDKVLYKQRIVANLQKTPIVEIVCQQSGIPRSTYYRWRKEDQAFADAADEALAHSSALINDLAESQLISAIKEKNLTAIIFWLKHHHLAYETRIKVDANVRLEPQELTPEQADLVAQGLRHAGLLPPEGEFHDEP
jgi:transposase-like protein